MIIIAENQFGTLQVAKKNFEQQIKACLQTHGCLDALKKVQLLLNHKKLKTVLLTFQQAFYFAPTNKKQLQEEIKFCLGIKYNLHQFLVVFCYA